MSTSSRFVVAVHILPLLETEGGRPVTSAYVEGSVNTNPGVIRRLLSMLARAGLVTSQLGAGGGALLAKPARQIRLLDVYRAVESSDVFTLHHSPPQSAVPRREAHPAGAEQRAPARRAGAGGGAGGRDGGRRRALGGRAGAAADRAREPFPPLGRQEPPMRRP